MQSPAPNALRMVAALAAALAACTGAIGDPPSEAPPGTRVTPRPGEPVPPGTFVPAPATMRRLTTAQYRNTIADVFGEDAVPSASLDPDEATELFTSIGASRVATSARGVEQYRDAALEVAAAVVASRERFPVLAGCGPADRSDPCVADVVSDFGLRLWRRPLTDAETARIAGIVAAAGSDDPAVLELGMKYAIAALLQAPSFLYVVQAGELDPATGMHRYTGYEIASRLSYFLWDSAPDAELLDAAANGELDTPEGIARQASRMLDAPRARGLAGRFFAESWKVARLDVTDKNPEVFPTWSEALLRSYLEEFDRVLADLVARDADLLDILDGRETLVDAELAAAYGLDVSPTDGFVRATLDGARSGLLTSGAVVSANSPSDRTSPTHRGVFVLERILCEEIPPPPPSVDDTLSAGGDGTTGEPRTIREALERHRTDPACASCHSLFDPVGLTFENFDGIGQFRTEDNGVPVDATGELGGRTFDGVRDVAAFLREDPRTTRCVSERLYAYAVGHEAMPGEDVVVDEATRTFEAESHSFRQLVLSIVTSDGFRYAQAEE